eukprot:gb/GFBE01010244.1/.p1 GENE.gb/GFBE01010244.1/~~gb/GFBE01010244.1/.p1  ORF type:complete len:277 (+),score=77.40 gb/GFBE01010244.1/:1-831(+)
MHEDADGGAAGGSWTARHEERVKNLRDHVKDQQNEREKKELRRKESEKKLVDEYMQHMEREKAAKKEEIRKRLERLQAQKAKKSISDQGATSSPELLAGSGNTAGSQGLARSGTMGPELSEAAVQSKEAQALVSPAGSAQKKSPAGKRHAKGASRRRDADAEVRVDEKVAKLNESLGFRPMLNSLERIAASENGGAFRKLPKMQPITQKAPEDGDAEGQLDASQEQHYLRSQRHLARRQRLRLMNQVATEVLHGKKQLVHCFNEADFPLRALMFSS